MYAELSAHFHGPPASGPASGPTEVGVRLRAVAIRKLPLMTLNLMLYLLCHFGWPWGPDVFWSNISPDVSEDVFRCN